MSHRANEPLECSEIPLWPQDVAAAREASTLTPYWPDTASGAAMIVCPGGGYAALASHEGRDYALWLNEHGIAAFVLKYPLGSQGHRHPVMMRDAQRAIRLVRCRAAAWQLDPTRVGIMGSSAGGHLASTVLTRFDSGTPDAVDPVERFGCRPDIGILCYPVISMRDGVAHEGSRDHLLGPDPAPDLIDLLSNELHVSVATPPCFLWHTRDDPAVTVENSLLFAGSLLRNGVPFDLHIFERGDHGLGLGVQSYQPGRTPAGHLLPWTHVLARWLSLRGFLSETSGRAGGLR